MGKRSTIGAPLALALTAVLVSGVLWAAPPPAMAAGAGPHQPELVSPANGTTSAPGTSLAVRVSDQDDASLEVTFHAAAREVGEPPRGGAPFAFLTLPDTQGYNITPTYNGILNTQLQWIADHRSSLGLAFTTGLGDIVDNDLSAAQWVRASTSMSILDNARVPYAVLPGNHDFDYTTGDFAGYDAHFPVTRFRDAPWNSAAASYGGFYGQNQFGPDGSDRQNMNSYSLFSAGGMDFLLLDLELNAPDAVLAWAQRVLDAFPARRAIVATHAYVAANGTLSAQVLRTDVPGNSGAQIFQKLVYPNCRVFLVVNGHFSNGTEGEAHRTDRNACGKPVYGVLTDFQGRGNGGDGWLRYYVFTPAANEIKAVTYSPSLNLYDLDSESAFTLPYDMTNAEDLPVIGSTTAASGTIASLPLPDLDDGTVLDWYVTVGDGTTQTRGPTWSTTIQTAPTEAPLAADTFERAAAAGWGSADIGGQWTVNSTAKTSVSTGSGRVAVNAGSTLTSSLALQSTDVDASITIALDRLPNQYLTATLASRQVGSSGYGARLRVNPNGSVVLQVMRDAVTLAGATVPGVAVSPGARLRLRVQTEGTSPTTIRARVWPEGSAEPTTWQHTATDSTAALQAPGGIRISTYLSSAATNGPVAVSYDNLSATSIGSVEPPANAAPHAAFTWSATGLTISADSSSSRDDDGGIVTRAWSFDGTARSGSTATHTFPAAGSYPVTLTVTDDDGATDSVTQTVTVTAPPSTNVLASDAFARTLPIGWGDADAGGAWTVNAAAKFSVSGGTGKVAANPGSTLNATLGQVTSTTADARVTVSLDEIPDQYLNIGVTPRVVGSSAYGARLRVNPNGSLVLQTMRDAAVLSGGTLPGITLAAGSAIDVRVQVSGTSPTTIRARAWIHGTTEPAAWQYSATDTTSGLQTAGAIRITTYLASSATSGTVAVSYDDLVVATIP